MMFKAWLLRKTFYFVFTDFKGLFLKMAVWLKPDITDLVSSITFRVFKLQT